MSFMSTTTIKTDVTSKVLPGDKSGLPLEIWQIIFSHLSVRDLCHVGMVSKTWYELSLSIDMTRWKELYLACSEWRHPSWPLNIHREPPSWKNAYREQYLSTRFWLHCARQVQMTGCISLLKRNRERRSIKVGPGLEYQTLKSALAVASEYDQILMHPGIYDEHVEMSLKIPFELIGVGELGSVILVVCIEQIAQTGRLSNLVLRAPWFTTFILKVRSGYLQVDNCIIEGGVVYVQNPATCHIQFCSFRHSSIILQHINAGMVRNCEFSQSDNANIIVEGHVKEEKNWASSKLRQQIIAIFENRQPQIRKHQLKQTDSTTSTLHSNVTGKSFTTCTLKTFDITSNVQGIPDATTCKQNPIDPERELSANNAEVQEFQYGPQAKHRPMSIGSARHMELPRKDLTLSPKTLMSVQCGKNQHGSSVELSHRLCALDTFTGQEESISEVKCQACRKNSRSSDRQDGELEKKLDGEKNSQRKISRSSISESVSNAEQNICFVSSTEDAESVFHASRSTLDHHHIHRPKPESCASCRAEFGVIGETALERSKPITVEGNDGLCHSKEQETILRGFCSEHLPLGSHATLTENFLDSGDATAGSLLQATLSQFQQVSQLLHQHPDSSTSRSKSLDPLLTQKPCSHTASNPSEGDLNKPHTFGDKEPVLLLDLGQPKSVSNPDLNSLSDSKKNTLNRSLQANSDEVDNPVAQHSDPEHVREALDIHRECSHLKKTLQDYSQRLPQHNCLADCNDSASQHHLHMLQNHCSVSQQLDNPFPQQQFPAVHLHQQSGRCSSPQESGDHKAQHHPAVVDHAGDAAERQSHQSYSSSDTNISDDDDMISILDELDSGRSSSAGESYGNNSTSSIESDSDVEGFFHAGNDYDLSDGEESVIMLPHLRQKHLDISLSANAVNADVGSICSQTTRPIAFSPCQDEDILKYVNQVHGCLIHQCRMTHSKGGVMVSLQAQAFISECDISNVFYGIRCIQNSQIVVMKNRIHHCRTSGIFMRMAACGMIAGNDIHSNNEAGIDIRKNADPIVQHNNIHHGKRSGVVVLGSGHGQIKKNYIHNNAEAGIYILYGGNPTVRENHIFDGKAAGVAVNEGGRGFIFDNIISGNQWGGVDIRHGGCPVVSSNTITEGLGDGVVIGDQGQGVIENNVISDNNGCGVWIMSASQPYIHGNQINNNSDAGIMMVNKSDVQHDGNYLVPPVSVGVNHSSRSYSLLGALMEDIPLPTPKCTYTTVQYNNIYHNSGRGMIVELGDKVDILFNAVYANHQDGVWVNQEAPVSVSHNSISNNHGCGVITSMTSSLKIYGNGIYNNCEQGIQCQSNAEIKDNDVVGNQTGGILLESASVCKVHGNRVQSVMGPAVKVGASVLESVVSDNKIFSNGEEDIVNLSKRAVVQDNEILQPYAFGTNGQTRHKGKNPAFAKTDFLNNPPARPHIEPPPPPSLPPAHHITAVTKVMVPSGDSCQQGSKLCCIL